MSYVDSLNVYDRFLLRIDHAVSINRDEIIKIETQSDMCKHSLVDIEKEKNEKTTLIVQYSQAQTVLHMVQQNISKKIKDMFDTVVTQALQFVVGHEYAFSMFFGVNRQFNDVTFAVTKQDMTIPYDLMTTSGGGIIDIIACALRIVLLELYQPRLHGPLLLDESFKHVSQQYLQSIGRFLYYIAKRIDRQIILVSHRSALIDAGHNVIWIDRCTTD